MYTGICVGYVFVLSRVFAAFQRDLPFSDLFSLSLVPSTSRRDREYRVAVER